MDSLLLASATDLAKWASTRRAQEQLSEALRRMVYATTANPLYVDFPAGDAIQLGGFDGAVEVDEDHPFVPNGFSVWEVGTDSNPKKKADSDYKKRKESQPTTARGVVNPPDATFVFVTPRRWAGKDDWAESRRSEDFWKDVRVIDADDLEAWLQQAPAAHVWLSRLMGRLPAGVDDVEAAWADWAESIKPTASTELVLAGRQKEAGQIVEWLSSRAPGSLIVSAESTEDAFGVVAAAIVSIEEDERAPVFARTVVVTTSDGLTQLSSATDPLVFIPTYGAGNEVSRAVRGGHQVLIPSSPITRDTRAASIVAIPRLSRYEATRALVKMGLTEQRASDLAGVGRRSVLTLRRQLAKHASLRNPAWSSPSSGPALVPMLLLGQFNERHTADLQALKSLAPNGLDATKEELLRWSQELDPPVRRTGDIWYLVSKEDAWALLNRYVTSDDLDRFRKVAMDILREVHPKFDLSPEQRWAASMHGKERQYSGILATGVADTIALMGALGGAVTILGGSQPAMVGDRIVRELFDSVAGDWRGWATLSHVLPLLAEGAPDVFLEAVRTHIASNEAAAQTLFRDEGNAMFSSASHTGLLWALEVVAWSPVHLASAARTLASLDRLDPGGRLLNRPRNSLRSIFLFWLPQTAADVDTRLSVLAQLRRWEPEVAWRLFEALLPRISDHSSHNPRPKWRDWGAAEQAIYADIYRQTSAMIQWMVEDAGDNPSRWSSLIDALDKVRREDFKVITDGIRHFVEAHRDDTARGPVFDALRELLSRHRSFPNADWVLPPEALTTIDTLFKEAMPTDPLIKYRWLFSYRPQLPEGREQDLDKYQEIVLERRTRAVNELHSTLGVEGVANLSARVEHPDELGRILAMANLMQAAEEDRFLQHYLSATERSVISFARGYAHGWTARLGPEVARERIGSGNPAWSDETRARLLLAQRPSAATFDIVDSLNASGQTAFWAEVYPVWFDVPDLERGLRGLLEHHRPIAFVDAAAIHIRQHPALDASLIAAGLKEAAQQSADKEGLQIDPYDVTQLLDALERAVNEGRFQERQLAELEFLYLPILDRHTRLPRSLHNALAKDPMLFVDAVKRSFRAKGEERKTLTSEEAILADRAYHLLQTWRTPPGKTDTGFNAEIMNEWVDTVRAELRSTGRLDIGDQIIGQIMSSPAPDSDGVWPAIPIRDLIERLESEQFERGLEIGRFNSRGVIMRNPGAGGDLERGEARNYEKMAGTASGKWPRTAAMLRRLERNSLADAAREDADSELQQDLYD
jgi:hypothetical protein